MFHNVLPPKPRSSGRIRVGMMTPSAAPILMYARVGRHAEAQGTPLVATVWFVAGYFPCMVTFALLATLVQWALERTALLESKTLPS
jgi:predicted metal-binding membrane protein